MAGPPFGWEVRRPVTNQVTTTPGFGRPSKTSPGATLALTCGNQTQRDTVGQNHAAWHAEGQGIRIPLNSTNFPHSRSMKVTNNLSPDRGMS
jgi:hypothetical protein